MADQYTGGMIALVPKDPAKLTVPGGDPAKQMHLTLAYLGDDVTAMDEAKRKKLGALIGALARRSKPVDGTAFGHAVFNPNSSEHDPATVHMVNGDFAIHEHARKAAKAVLGGDMPEQHPTFIPHVTAGYNLPLSKLSYTGPVKFDRLRLALGGEVTDYPLGRTVTLSNTVELSKKTAMLERTPAPLGKPGGPGLFNMRGARLPNYVEQLATALLQRGRVKDKSRAIQLAIGAVQRWARGGDNVSPEVRAAAAKALAEWEAAKVKARAKPNKSDHSNTYDKGGLITTGTKPVVNGTGKPINLSQPRRPKGNTGAGQWYGEPDYPTEPRTREVPKVTAANLPELRKRLQDLVSDGAELSATDAANLARDLALASARVAEQAIELANSTRNTMEKASKTVAPGKTSLEDRLHAKLKKRGVPDKAARKMAKKAAARARRQKITGPPTPAKSASMSSTPDNVVELAKTPPRLRQSARKKAAKQKKALGDGSFPMRTKGELSDALQSWGRAVRAGKAAKVKRLALKRAREMGAGKKTLDRIKSLKVPA